MSKTIKEKVEAVLKVKKTTKVEEKKVEACSNCGDSGLVCSVCRAGYDVV